MIPTLMQERWQLEYQSSVSPLLTVISLLEAVPRETRGKTSKREEELF